MNDDKVDQELDAMLKADDKQAESFGTQVLRLIYKMSFDCEEGCDMCPHIAEIRLAEEVNKLHATALAAARVEGFRKAMGLVATLPTRGTKNFQRGYEEALHEALRHLEAAAKEGE